MKYQWVISVLVGMVLLTPLGQAGTEYVWTERGCNASYTVGEKITVYFVTIKDVEFELWAYDVLMRETVLASGVGDGSTFFVEVTASMPSGPFTFVLKMPCNEECEACLCDLDQCTLHIQEEECEGHCSNGKQDCGERGIDCGGGCPFTDSDDDGIEDCRDQCPDTECRSISLNGCELDSDGDSIGDCSDQCPLRRGDLSNGGCPTGMNYPLYLVGGVAIVAAGIAVWKLR
ncbi:MAG: hypothetical protein HXS52_00915 [Theionarchaea archaeon]|nr:hypothetical protein [Theionarchaea archaeon]